MVWSVAVSASATRTSGLPISLWLKQLVDFRRLFRIKDVADVAALLAHIAHAILLPTSGLKYA